MGKKQDTFDFQNMYQSAISLHQQGENSHAINLYCQILEHFPGAAEIHYNLGLALFELDQYAEAIEAYKQAAELNPQDSDIFYNLGLACKMVNRFDEAEEAYLNALDFTDDVGDILYNLGCCYQDSGAIEQACIVFERLLELIPDHLSALNNLAFLQHLQKNFDIAKELYGQILELDPNRHSAQHMFAILSGKVEQAPPREYVREIFDQYSDRFEENLVKDLEYNTFCILRQAIEGLSKKKSLYEHGLDLGCGTGLAGETFHPICSKLTGVDLSQNMLDKAAQKQLYSYLHCSDIIEFLEHTDHNYDLIIAADLLPYIGTLKPLFSAVSEHAAKNALFCLSSETTVEPEWELQLTGRYAHNPDYIAQTAVQNGWSVLEWFPANIRKENEAWIKGTIFVLRNKR